MERGRIAWQLDQLRQRGVGQVVISYPHGKDGSTDLGMPVLFSPEWWDLFRWFLVECRERGMTAGFQDYTLVTPILQQIGLATPGMEGGQMVCAWAKALAHEPLSLTAESGTRVIAAWAYPFVNGTLDTNGLVDVLASVESGRLQWQPPMGEWLVALVFIRPAHFDPLHPQSGKLAIEKLYAPFERECPGEIGRTLKTFFQDELDFGFAMPFWSEHLRGAFSSLHGYDLWPKLPALWLDLGPETTKIRLDYADVICRELERNYFKPIFEWHEQHGTLFGHDNLGRGEIRRSRHHYGDYFRAMRWYSAPGCDDPKIDGVRAFKGLKVNSSIAHLYQRPRVWVEAFHSSGWGTTPGEVVAALNEDFAYGANVVNLHGLYYSTNGGWWEWAPPDFHFRQPYWEHCGSLNDYFTRLSWLLSQGTHRCDVAILYPSATLEAEPANNRSGVHGHMGHEDVDDTKIFAADAERTTFGLGKYLFNRACDFDLLDFESLERATVAAGQLSVSGESYRVLVLPAMPVVRHSTLLAARDFVRAGGLVIACGCLPHASERGADDEPEVAALVAEIFSETPSVNGGRGILVEKSYSEVLRWINQLIPRDVECSVSPLQVLHRHLENQEVFYVFNPAETPLSTEVKFRAVGPAELWDAWTANVTPLMVSNADCNISTLKISLAAREARVIVFRGGSQLKVESAASPNEPKELLALTGEWQFTARPTLDNQFGDYRLPAAKNFIGPEARQFKWAEEFSDSANWHELSFDDADWPQTTYSFGPRFEVLGPLPPGAKLEGRWQPYAFSLRWGIERDPFLTDWLSGPHGLKGQVPDEFLDFHCDQPGHEWHLRSQVIVPTVRESVLRVGARCAYQVWLNDELVAEQREALPPGRHAPWNIPHYDCVPIETRVKLRAGVNQLRVKLVQPSGQRTRAFVAFDPPATNPGQPVLRWFTDSQVPRPALLAAPERKAVWLRCATPPGLKGIEFVARGSARVWVDGSELPVVALQHLPGGCVRCRVVAPENYLYSTKLAIRVVAEREYRAGDVLPEPVRFDCRMGLLSLGDWCAHGMAVYSGIGEYEKAFLFQPPAGRKILLDFGGVAATAEVLVNGISAGVLSAPPWRVDVTEMLQAGINTLTVRVANTLANHYSVGIPSPYAFPHQTRSGLFGPIRFLLDQD
ncbi:MAG: hypothetical protein RLY20_1337 [Verrucomicrobiota bacterium]